MDDVLKHATGTSKLSEVALVCLLDVCRAATYVKAEGEVPLRMAAFDIAHDIKASWNVPISLCIHTEFGYLGFTFS